MNDVALVPGRLSDYRVPCPVCGAQPSAPCDGWLLWIHQGRARWRDLAPPGARLEVVSDAAHVQRTMWLVTDGGSVLLGTITDLQRAVAAPDWTIEIDWAALRERHPELWEQSLRRPSTAPAPSPSRPRSR